jgi:hypothetical protein
MPGRKIALNLRGLIFLPHIFLLKPGPVRDPPPRIFETIRSMNNNAAPAISAAMSRVARFIFVLLVGGLCGRAR